MQKTSNNIYVRPSADLQKKLAQERVDAIARSIELLGALRPAKSALIANVASSAGAMAAGSLDHYGQNFISPGYMPSNLSDAKEMGLVDPLSSRSEDGAWDKIMAVLEKCWEKVTRKIRDAEWFKKAQDGLGLAATILMDWIKTLLLSGQVISKLVPFYGSIRGVVDGALLAFSAVQCRDTISDLVNTSVMIDSGVPKVAMDAFRNYVILENVRLGAKSAYIVTKSIGNFLAEVLTFGAWTVASFVTAIVEAVASIVTALVQFRLFDKATEKLRVYSQAGDIPDADEFRSIISFCPLIGAVFFGGASYIGHFQLTRVLTKPAFCDASYLNSALPSIAETQRHACAFIRASGIQLKFRSADEEKRLGWVVKQIEGYSTNILTEIHTKDNPGRKAKTEAFLRRKWHDFSHKSV